MNFQRRVWHIDAAFAVLLAALMAAAYYFDGPQLASNSFKPSPQPDAKSPCIDGQPPVNWICPDGVRL